MYRHEDQIDFLSVTQSEMCILIGVKVKSLNLLKASKGGVHLAAQMAI